MLSVLVGLVLLGRGYQYVFFGAPLEVLLWDERLMTGFVERVLGMTWGAYASDTDVAAGMQTAAELLAGVYVTAGIAALVAPYRASRLTEVLLVAGGVLLAAHAALVMKDRFGQWAQFFEFAIQIGSPFLLIGVLRGWTLARLTWGARALIAVTFAAHGLYAIGFYAVPGHFIDMTIGILGVTEDVAVRLLWWAGLLDWVVAFALLLPYTYRYALGYAVVWGGLTALARIVAGWDGDFPVASLHQALYETVYRLPHGLLPLCALLWSRSRLTATSQTEPQHALTLHTEPT